MLSVEASSAVLVLAFKRHAGNKPAARTSWRLLVVASELGQGRRRDRYRVLLNDAALERAIA